jgi:chemotaxis protein MotB
VASIKKKSGGGGGANWMDTYGDMVTLLLCFFVLLYSISTVDQNKWILLVQSFNKDALVNVDEQPLGPEGEDSDQGGDDMPTTLPEEIDQVMDELYDFLALFAASSDSVNISTTGDGRIFISFQDAVFFDGDKSVLRPEGKAALDEIIPALEEAGPYLDEVKIMGHTAQARPDQANTVRGDRTLSTQRAAEVLIYIQEHSNGELLDPARLTSEGYGQWRPVATNDTAEGRAKNRRVEMMISGKNVEEQIGDSIASYYTETQQTQPGSEQPATPAEGAPSR